MAIFQEQSLFIWDIVDILKKSYKRNEFHRIILPFTLLKRVDSVLKHSQPEVNKIYEEYKGSFSIEDMAITLQEVLFDEKGNKINYYNVSGFTFEKLLEDSDAIEENLLKYIDGFSSNVKEILENFEMKYHIKQLSKTNILYLLISKFSEDKIDLSLKTVSNQEMGIIFEELINKCFKNRNKDIGGCFTPRDVAKLMSELIFINDESIIENENIKTIYDPACGTGGMLTSCEEHILSKNTNQKVSLYGQEINPEIFAICKAKMLLKGYDANNIKGPSSTLSDDRLPGKYFDYIISNPPYGRDWEMDKTVVNAEAELGEEGRFKAGTPRKNDGQLLFIQHMISKMKENEKSRIAVITSGSPLFTGDAGSGESNIRKWIIENDYLEAIIALPENLFHNTNITTYIWILTNEKTPKRINKVQLIDAREEFTKINEKTYSKKYVISKKNIKNILKVYKNFKETNKCKIFDNEDLGYSKVVVERPLQRNYQVTEKRLNNIYSIPTFKKLLESKNKNPEEKIQEEEQGKQKQQEIIDSLKTIGDEKYTNWDEFECEVTKSLEKIDFIKPAMIEQIILKLSEHDETAEIVTDNSGNPKADYELRKYKKIPLKKNIHNYFNEVILPNYSEAWIDTSRIKIGYEINFKHLIYDERLFFDEIEFPIYDLSDFVYFEEINEINNSYDLIIKLVSNLNQVIYYPYELLDYNIKTDNKRRIYLIGCKIKSNQITKEYLYCYLNSKKSLQFLKEFQLIPRTYRLDDLYFIKIPLPDIKTQTEIVKTFTLMEEFFNEMDLWKTNYQNNILNYKPTLDSYKEFSCSISFGDDGSVKDFCHNWRIVYQGLIWPLAYTYLKATKGSKNESTLKNNIIILFEFLAAFNVIILISGINNSKISEEDYKDIKNELWELYNENKKTWHKMTFGSWTTLYKRLRKIYNKYDIETPVKDDFFKKLSNKKNEKLFQKLRVTERNTAAHGGIEDDIDVETKLEDLKMYVNNDILNILNLYSGLKLYHTQGNSNRISPNVIEYQVMSLNGPCDPPNWHKFRCNEELEPYSLYLYDSLNDSLIKIDSDLIRFGLIPETKQYGIFIYDRIDTGTNNAIYKCYHQKDAFLELTLNSDEDTYEKISKSFLKEVLKL